ncbi:MAG: hypothetical protein ACI9NG_002896 [Hyphomonas sp.]|jgi:hypothetical protein
MRRSQLLDCANTVFDTRLGLTSLTDREGFIQPGVPCVARLELDLRKKKRVTKLAILTGSEPGSDAVAEFVEARITHMNQGLIVGLESLAYVEPGKAARSTVQPVSATREDATAQALALEAALADNVGNPMSERGLPDGLNG